jgi:hypothetical protein
LLVVVADKTTSFDEAARNLDISLYRRPYSPHWWTRFQVGGHEVRLTTSTRNRRDAEEFETAARTRARRQARLGERAPVRWTDAAARWLTETRKRSKRRDESILAWIDEHLNYYDVQTLRARSSRNRTR